MKSLCPSSRISRARCSRAAPWMTRSRQAVSDTCSSAAASGDFKLGSVCADLKSDPEQDVYRFAREHFERLAWPELYANDNWWKKMSDEDLLIFLTELFVAAGVCSRCTTTATTATTTTAAAAAAAA